MMTANEILGIASDNESEIDEMAKMLQANNSEETTKPRWWSLCGRSRRSDWWMVQLCVLFPIGFSYGFIAIALLSSSITNLIPVIIGGVLVVIACFVLSFPVSIRRLHDRNIPGVFYWIFRFIGIIPYLNIISAIAEFVILGCLDGTVGPNDFGPDPRGRDPNWVQPLQRAIAGTQIPVQNSKTVEDRLRELARLKEAGIVSDAEYEQKRQKLIDEI